MDRRETPAACRVTAEPRACEVIHLERIHVVPFERLAEAGFTDEGDAALQECNATFPHSVVLEGAVAEYFFATRWCWQNFGARDGECYEMHSEYPGCPLVLATSWVENVGGRNRMRYAAVDAHVHQGSWTNEWLGKIDYDYGFSEFSFASKAALESFVAAIPTFSWGENFES